MDKDYVYKTTYKILEEKGSVSMDELADIFHLDRKLSDHLFFFASGDWTFINPDEIDYYEMIDEAVCDYKKKLTTGNN